MDEVAVLPFRRHGCSCFERTELTMVAHEVELEHCGWESTQEIVTTLKACKRSSQHLSQHLSRRQSGTRDLPQGVMLWSSFDQRFQDMASSMASHAKKTQRSLFFLNTDRGLSAAPKSSESAVVGRCWSKFPLRVFLESEFPSTGARLGATCLRCDAVLTST